MLSFATRYVVGNDHDECCEAKEQVLLIIKTTLMKHLGDWFRVTCERVACMGDHVYDSCIAHHGGKHPG